MTRRIFCDLDGVLADLVGGYEAAFGTRPETAHDDIDWTEVANRCPDFFLDLPMLPDARRLWQYISRWNPPILTGIPKEDPVRAEFNKRVWIARNISDDAAGRAICCRASEKWMQAKPGDILIDDWEKYRKRWERAGGIWITHMSADSTILQLEAML